MKENIDEMRKRHENEIKELQENCEHPIDSRSDWINEYWAIAHTTGDIIRTCLICGKIIDRITPDITGQYPTHYE